MGIEEIKYTEWSNVHRNVYTRNQKQEGSIQLFFGISFSLFGGRKNSGSIQG